MLVAENQCNRSDRHIEWAKVQKYVQFREATLFCLPQSQLHIFLFFRPPQVGHHYSQYMVRSIGDQFLGLNHDITISCKDGRHWYRHQGRWMTGYKRTDTSLATTLERIPSCIVLLLYYDGLATARLRGLYLVLQ